MEAPEKLKPCPFCGVGGARIDDGFPWFQCMNCGASGPKCGADGWNTRASTMPGELVEEWKSILYGTPLDAFNNRDDDGLLSPTENGDRRIIEAIRRTLAWAEGRAKT